MQNKNPKLGPLGIRFFSYVQARHLSIVHLGELQRPLGLTPLQERRLLARLNKSDFIFRLQRGIYIIPDKITSGSSWMPSEYLVIARYMEAHDAQYYLGGLMAFNRHGLSTQIANQFTVYNNKVSALKKFGKFTVKFIKVASKRICDFDSFPIPGEQQNVNIANLARTILDAIHDWKTYQILSQAYGWLKKYSADRKFLSDFIRLTAQTANCNTKRRVGFYLEKLGVNNSLLLPILKKLNPTAGWIALNPSSNQTGKTIKKWGIIDNVKYPQ